MAPKDKPLCPASFSQALAPKVFSIPKMAAPTEDHMLTREPVRKISSGQSKWPQNYLCNRHLQCTLCLKGSERTKSHVMHV